MKPAADAMIVDSTGLSADEVVDRLARDLEDHLVRPPAVAGSSKGPLP